MDYKKIMDSLFKENFELEQQRDQYKEERDTLKDELSRYEEKVSRLEDEKDDMLLEREYYKNRYEDMTRRCKEMEQKNVGLKLMNESSDKQLEIFHRCFNSLLTKIDINKDKDNLLSEISQHIGNKPSSNTYKYFRETLDSIGIKEDE